MMRLTECVARCLAAEKACVGTFDQEAVPEGLRHETWPKYWDEALRIMASLDDVPTFGRTQEFTAAVRAEIAWAGRQLKNVVPVPKA